MESLADVQEEAVILDLGKHWIFKGLNEKQSVAEKYHTIVHLDNFTRSKLSKVIQVPLASQSEVLQNCTFLSITLYI